MSLLSIDNLSKEEILSLIKRAIEFKNGSTITINQSVANIFIEPSTRTMMSFQKAQNNLGMEIYNLTPSSSSFKKGELLEDTLLNLQAIGINNFVIRSTDEHYWEAFESSQFNIINGGDGTKNHPSQALLDAMTIYEHFNTLENLKVLIVGDTKHSRVYHSNKMLLEKLGSKIDSISIGDNKKLENIISSYDVVMMLRVQHERHNEKMSVSGYNEKYGLNSNIVSLMNEKSIFLHPGPINRDVEITSDLLYKHPKNKILEQAANGVFTRMAILEKTCKNI